MARPIDPDLSSAAAIANMAADALRTGARELREGVQVDQVAGELEDCARLLDWSARRMAAVKEECRRRRAAGDKRPIEDLMQEVTAELDKTDPFGW